MKRNLIPVLMKKFLNIFQATERGLKNMCNYILNISDNTRLTIMWLGLLGSMSIIGLNRLPMWSIIVPIAIFTALSYFIKSMTKYIIEIEIGEKKNTYENVNFKYDKKNNIMTIIEASGKTTNVKPDTFNIYKIKAQI